MQVPCPHCKRLVNQFSDPIRGPAGDGSELWVCLKCPMIVCSHPIMKGEFDSTPCYIEHMSKAHPEMYRLGAPTGSKKKKKK
jgi:hypothetical protein